MDVTGQIENMKTRLLTLITCLLMAGCVAEGRNAPKVKTLVNEYRHQEGVEVVSLGPATMGILKAVARHCGDLDDEDRMALKTVDGIKGLTIMDFEDADEAVKGEIARKLDKVLSKMDLLLEVKDDGDIVRIYGRDDGKKLHDCIIYCNDGTLICTRGAVDTDKMAELVALAQ